MRKISQLLSLMALVASVVGCSSGRGASHYESTRQWVTAHEIESARITAIANDGGSGSEVEIQDQELLRQIKNVMVNQADYCGYDPIKMPPETAYALAGDGLAGEVCLVLRRPEPKAPSEKNTLIINIHGMRFSYCSPGYDQDSFVSPALARLLIDCLPASNEFDQVRLYLGYHIKYPLNPKTGAMDIEGE